MPLKHAGEGSESGEGPNGVGTQHKKTQAACEHKFPVLSLGVEIP